MKRPLAGLPGAREGLAAVEFAMLLPVLILGYIGLADAAEAMMAQRRADHIANTIADLTSQSTAVSAANLNDYFSIGALVMAPFPTNTLGQRITCITANSSGVPQVAWSVGSGSLTGLTPGSTVTVPDSLLSAGQTIIEADVSYTYKNQIAWVLPTSLTFNQTAYLRPRQSSTVAYTG
jgi:Flp pilus assembly protein TadG